MRFALVSDQHFNVANRLAECVRVHDWIADDIAARRVDATLLGGDIWERANVPEDRNAAASWVRKLAQHAEVVGVYGNHENQNDAFLLPLLSAPFPITIYDRPAVHRVGNAAIACLPWPKRAQFIAALGPDANRETAAQDASFALQNVLRGLGDELDTHSGAERLFLGHVMRRGSKMQTGQPIAPGADFELGDEDFALVRAHAYLFGHIHARQDGLIQGAPWAYPGSPISNTWGEPGDHFYAIVEVENGVASFEFVKTPSTPMYLFEGTFADGALAITSKEFPSPDRLRGAEVRLRYSVASDDRVQAKAVVAALRAEWLAAGAIDVKPEPVVTAVSRARAPEIARAMTLAEQMAECWRARGLAIEDPRRSRVLAKLSEVDSGTRAAGAAGALRFDRVSIHGLGTPYRETYELDIAALQGPLVAIAGRNGIGKSMLLGFLRAALFRGLPDGTSLVELAAAAGVRDAMLDVDVTIGDVPYTFRHLVDGVASKSEALILKDGKPVLPTTSVRAFDAWVTANAPAPAVVDASLFSAQGSSGLLGMAPGERKKVLMRALGIEALEAKAEAARKRVGTAKTALDVAAARLADEERRMGVVRDSGRSRGGDMTDVAVGRGPQSPAEAVAHAESGATCARDRLARCVVELEKARAALDAVKAEAEGLKAREAANAAAKERRGVLDRAFLDAHDKVKALETRIANNRGVLVDREAILAAVARVEALTAEEGAAKVARAEAVAAETAARAAMARADADSHATVAKCEALRLKIQRIEARLSAKAEVDAAVEGLELECAVMADADAALEKASAEVRRLQGVALVGAEGRVVALRGALETVVDVGARYIHDGADPGMLLGNVYDAAAAAIRTDDETLLAAELTPVELREAQVVETKARWASQQSHGRVALLQTRAARAPEMAAAEADMAAAREEHVAAWAAADGAGRADDAATAASRAAGDARIVLDQRLAELAAERARISPMADRAKPLATAEGRLAELEPQLAAAKEDLAKATDDLAGWTPPAPLDETIRERLGTVSLVLADLTAQHQRAVGDVAVKEAAHRDAIAAAERIAALETERQALYDDHADWTLIVETILGVRDLVIDAAGPALTAMGNDLIHRCHGSRFTISVDSTRLSADGKRELEGCEITVIDSEEGREAPGEKFSGGERVILGEALSLSLAMLACQRGGFSGGITLVRDESGAALDPANGPVYIAMLRRAAELVGARHVLYVSHTPALRDLADSVVDLGARNRGAESEAA